MNSTSFSKSVQAWWAAAMLAAVGGCGELPAEGGTGVEDASMADAARSDGGAPGASADSGEDAGAVRGEDAAADASDGATDTDAESAVGDAGPSAAQPLPTLRFEADADHLGALGVFDWVHVEHDDGGNRIHSQRKLECDEDSGDEECSEPGVERYLSVGESEALRELVDAVPTGDCYTAHPSCDFPWILWRVEAGDETFAHVSCTFDTCEGYTASLLRLAALLGRLAAADEAPGEAEDCYSPTRLDSIREPGAEGCACDVPGQGLCLDGAGALQCEPIGDSPFTQWRTVVDGPCGPRSCAAGDAVAGLEACMQSHLLCNERRDGTFCTE